MSYSNIICNNSPKSGGVVFVQGFGIYQMNYCIFDLNKDTLLYEHTGVIIVSHSFISHQGVLSTRNNSLTKKPTYILQFFSSIYCNADSPFIKATPIKTLEDTLCMTPKETIHRSYDSECNKIINSEGVLWKKSFIFYPIILSILIV